MNAIKMNLLDRKYLASRISCAILAILLILYFIPRITLLWPAIISGSLALLFIVQFFKQNHIANLLLGSLMFFVGIYGVFAVISEFKEFETVTNEANTLLGVGLSSCLAVMFLAVLMIRRAIID